MSKKKSELEREIERELLEGDQEENDQAKESEKSNSTDKKTSFWKGLGGIEKIGIVGLCLLLFWFSVKRRNSSFPLVLF